MLLSAILITLIFSIIFIFFVDKNNLFLLRIISVFSSSVVLLFSSMLVANFDNNLYHFQNVVTFKLGSDVLNLVYSFGLDGISLLFLFLSSLLVFLTILFIWEDSRFKEYVLNLLVIELFLCFIFSTLDLFIFYAFFEAILIPMYLIIGIWGSRQRKIRAVYLFFFILFADLF